MKSKKIAIVLMTAIMIGNLSMINVNATNIDENKADAAITISVDISPVKKQSKEEWKKKYPKLRYFEKKDIENVNYSENTIKEINEIYGLIDKGLETNDRKLTLEIKDRLLKLHTEIENSDMFATEETDQFNYIGTQLVYLIFTQYEGAEREQMLSDLADDMYRSLIRRYNSGKSYTFLTNVTSYIGFDLVDYISNDRVRKTLTYAACDFIDLDRFYVDENNPPKLDEENVPSKNNPEIPNIPDPIPDDPGNPNPGGPNDPLDNPQEPTGGEGTRETILSTFYELINDRCVERRVEADIYTGQIISDVFDYTDDEHCAIYIEDNTPTVDNWNDNYIVDYTLQLWNGLVENSLNKESNYTIQFTLDKTAEEPYYYDTRIRTSLDKTVSYNQLKNTLNQIISKNKENNIFLIEDKEKALFIAEGKPFVFVDKKAEYSEEEVDKLLDKFDKLDMKIDEIKGNTSTPTDEVKVSKTIKIDNKEYILKNEPIVKDGATQLPLNEIAEIIGANVEKKGKELIIKYNDNEVKVEVGTKNIYLNNNKKITSTVSYENNGVVYGEFNLIAKTLGVEITINNN